MSAPQALMVGAFVATVLTQAPQLRHTYNTQETAAFSWYTMALRVVASVCWVAYALLQKEWVMLAVSASTLLGESALIAMKYVFERLGV